MFAALLILAFGPGKISLDALISRVFGTREHKESPARAAFATAGR